MINWYTLQSNYHAIIIFCSSHPKQIKPIINYYLCNIREILRDAVGPFLLFCSRFPCPRAARPRVASRRPPRDLQRRRCSKQSCDWDEVCGELPACVCVSVTTSQPLLRDITPDNLPWIFIRRRCLAHTGLHTHIHRWSSYTTMLLWSKRAHYLPVVPQSSAEITNQPTLSELGSLFCLSQHTVSFGRQHFNHGTFDSLSSHQMLIRESVQWEPFDCINDKWESVSDLSLVCRLIPPRWRFLSDNQPLEMNGQIAPQDVPFDMRGPALMHTWWQSISEEWEWDLTRMIHFWRRLNDCDYHRSDLSIDLRSCHTDLQRIR